MVCPNCKKLWLEIDLLTAERDAARAQAAQATDLMMKGEALRDRMFLHAIVGGVYDRKEGESPCSKK